MPSRRTDTPMMKQYLALKAQVPDALLFFRMGDFYELFLEDAETAAPLLDLVLTSRDRDAAAPIPMCGVPFHAAEGYIRRLLEAGHSVAIGEQVEDPKLARGLVRREIVEVISPGLVANGTRLSDAAPNYLASVVVVDGRHGLAYIDVSTGEFAATELADRASVAAELARVAPREVLVRDTDKDLIESRRMRIVADAEFDPATVCERIDRVPHGYDRHDTGLSMRAAAAIWSIVAQFQPAALGMVETLRTYRTHDRMLLDPATRQNLELLANARDGSRRGSLLEALDETRTPMGKRLLIQRIGAPLRRLDEIRLRQDAVQSWLEPDSRRRRARDPLRGVGDLERLITRLGLSGSGVRELTALRSTLGAVLEVHAIAPLEGSVATALEALWQDLEYTLVDDPPAAPRGEPYVGYIRDGVDRDVDRIRADAEEGNAYLAGLEARERDRTGIKGLRVKYNRVFGYSIEVSRAQAGRVPESYRRKQTTANAERFTTEELSHWEALVLRAREGAAAAEQRAMEALRARALEHGEPLRTAARTLAELDVAQSLAQVARERDYVRPILDDSLTLSIEAGRHPVAERFTQEGFVPNDVALDGACEHFSIVTGPNMAGKSTLLRQVALIALMAQMGSWVPARSARIGVVDRIFTRVGASDSLLTGESTFMVEMRETATILNEATPRSLVLLDEIGRGTSTFDGLSIAWAVAEHLTDAPGLRPRALFATHYHELADLARTRPGVRNFHFGCTERGGQIAFLRRMEPGAASRSYGIEVARHAGLPPQVIRRASEILVNLEGEEFDENGRPRLARHAQEPNATGQARSRRKSGKDGATQLELFSLRRRWLDEALRELEPEHMTPVEALVKLAEIVRRLREEE